MSMVQTKPVQSSAVTGQAGSPVTQIIQVSTRELFLFVCFVFMMFVCWAELYRSCG